MVNKKAWSRFILTSALTSGLLLAAGSTARADRDWRNDCHRRLEADRAKIDRDANRFGNESRQVRRDVDRMQDDRQWCRNHHADWDHDRFDLGIYLGRGPR